MSGNRKKPLMGKILVTSGLALKIIQMICIAAGIEAMGGTVLTAITAVLLAGGLAVYSLERRYHGTVPLFGIICAVSVLLSVIKTETTFFPYMVFYLIVGSFGIMLISFGMGKRTLCGIAVIFIGGILGIGAIKGLMSGTVLTTVLLCAMYALMAVGLYL